VQQSVVDANVFQIKGNR